VWTISLVGNHFFGSRQDTFGRQEIHVLRGSHVLTKIFAVRVIRTKRRSEAIGRLATPIFKCMLIKSIAEELKAELNQILDSPLLDRKSVV